MPTEVKKNNNVLIGVLAVVTVIILAVMFRSPSTTTTTTNPPVDPNKPDPKVDPPKVDAPDPAAKKCYKRHTTDTSAFSLPTNYQLGQIVTELGQFYNNDFISNAAAFCKGMDIAFSVAIVKEYRSEIRQFMAKPPKKIVRNPDFHTEVQNQVFNPGDLECGTTTFSQHYLTRG